MRVRMQRLGWQAGFALICLGLGFMLVSVAGLREYAAYLAQRRLQGELAARVDSAAVSLTAPASAVAPPQPQADSPTTQADSPTRQADSPTTQADSPQPAALTQGAPLFRLEIPKITVQNIVVYGSSDAALKVGPGLLEDTALPGQAGNTVIVAHRDYYFWRLGELEPGDLIQVTSSAGSWNYRVKSKQVVKETQTEVADPTPEPTLTLITCWPLIFAGHTPDRLVVSAERQGKQPVLLRDQRKLQ